MLWSLSKVATRLLIVFGLLKLTANLEGHGSVSDLVLLQKLKGYSVTCFKAVVGMSVVLAWCMWRLIWRMRVQWPMEAAEYTAPKIVRFLTLSGQTQSLDQ